VDEEEKNYLVQTTVAVKRKIHAHVEFLARVSVPASERLRVSLMLNIAALSWRPAMHPDYESPVESAIPLKSKLAAKRYHIVFTVRGDKVIVVDVQDCRQDTDKNIV
jgi:hypothetical protein